MKELIVIFVFFSLIGNTNAQTVSPNGFSGLGLMPSASTLERGIATVSYDRAVPGKLINDGYNSQVGFGLTENFELVGRLATNNQKCNMYSQIECPSGTYRDFSSSVKWTLPIEQLRQNGVNVAVGATDFGGAATYFRSFYLVGSKKMNQFDLTAGWAKAQVGASMLDGVLASVTWYPTQWSQFNLQKVGQNTSAHALIKVPLLENSAQAWMTLNQRISENPVMPKHWMGWGISFPLDSVREKKYEHQADETHAENVEKKLNKGSPTTLKADLKSKGFFSVKVGSKKNGILVVEIENTAYAWNILDAAGVALGVISGAYAGEINEQFFDLILTTRGIAQLRVSAEAKCVGQWLEKGEACGNFQVQSMGQRLTNQGQSLNIAQSQSSENQINWTDKDAWNLRPEIILSPSVISAIGTEYGSLDLDVGANINAVLPLWPGATIETNRVEPLGVGTRQFEKSGAFFGSNIKGVTNRKLFHQLLNFADFNTQARLSAGTAYAVWDGKQVETSSQSDNGRHKLGYTNGSFRNESGFVDSKRNYRLLSYRFVNNDQQTAVTEFTQGKFWAGDKGISVNQRYWYGDTNLNVYFRRTRMGEGQPLVSFAGLQLSIPFTPRENKSLEYLGIRGVSQWTYSLETKVLEKDNIITGGYGEVPRIGDNLITIFNRDRNSTRYYDNNLNRIRNAYLNLGS